MQQCWKGGGGGDLAHFSFNPLIKNKKEGGDINCVSFKANPTWSLHKDHRAKEMQ